MQHSNLRTLQILQSTGGDHLTEDACFGAIYEHHAVLAVADGAPVRLQPVPSLRPLIAKFAPLYGAEITPSGIASRLVRDTIARHAPDTVFTPLAQIITEANERLATELRAIYDELSAEAVLRHEPTITILAEDPRYLRLLLPVCTYTAVRVDFARNQLEVAHGADSALLVFMCDGSVQQITPDQMAPHDDAFKRLWLSAPIEPAQHPFFRALGDNRGRELNRMNGLYHNYVAANGATDAAVGVSVVNGLEQMRAYMFTQVLPLTDVEALLVVSDGVFLPLALDSDDARRAARLNEMGQIIRARGLAGYLDALRVEERRLRETGINPYQTHDDASLVMLTVSTLKVK